MCRLPLWTAASLSFCWFAVVHAQNFLYLQNWLENGYEAFSIWWLTTGIATRIYNYIYYNSIMISLVSKCEQVVGLFFDKMWDAAIKGDLHIKVYIEICTTDLEYSIVLFDQVIRGFSDIRLTVRIIVSHPDIYQGAGGYYLLFNIKNELYNFTS